MNNFNDGNLIIPKLIGILDSSGTDKETKLTELKQLLIQNLKSKNLDTAPWDPFMVFLLAMVSSGIGFFAIPFVLVTAVYFFASLPLIVPSLLLLPVIPIVFILACMIGDIAENIQQEKIKKFNELTSKTFLPEYLEPLFNNSLFSTKSTENEEEQTSSNTSIESFTQS